ncbi:uncharacterized protein [Antedon mediterranea]|uniref:uncharacterized protein n=1 Tax=Antedon mediterranea TaxID=105859 RepID=UPI003AF97AAF
MVKIVIIFSDTINDLFLAQHVRDPTRYRIGEHPNVLDLVLTSNEDSISEVLQAPPLGKSDHMVLRFKIPVNLIKDEVVEVRNYFHADYDKFRGFLDGVDWDTELLDKDGLHSHGSFHEILSRGMEQFVPKCKKHLSGNFKRPLWFTKEVDKSIKQKNKYWKQYIKAKRKGHDCASVKWNTFIRVKNYTVNLIKSSKRIFENKITNEVKVNEKSFWRYINSQLNTRSGIPTLGNFEGKLVVDDQDKAESFNSFFSSVFCKENLSNVPNLDKKIEASLSDIEFNVEDIHKLFSNLVLIELKDQIAYSLSLIFTRLFNDQKVPISWKESIYLESNGLLCNEQFGFRQGRSCALQLLDVLESWTTNLHNHDSFDCVYLDYKKAFDSVPHQRLLVKLKGFGITGNLLGWFSNYLSNRTQRRDIDSASHWSNVWQLPFNDTKCKVFHYGRDNPNFLYSMAGNLLHEVKQEKDLGVTFDPSLIFNLHVTDICKRANKKLGMIYRFFKFLNKDGFFKLYKSMVRPTLEYCNTVYNPIRKRDQDEIEKVQQRAARLIPRYRNIPYEQRLRILGLPTMRYRRQRVDIIQVFRIVKGFDRISINTSFEFDIESRTRGHPYKLKFKSSRLNIRRDTFSRRVILL